MNRLIKSLLFLIELILIYLILYKNIAISCASKKLFNISCPACGLTRAFKSLLRLDIKSALNYNIISPLIFILLIFINICLIIDITKNKKNTELLFRKLGKFYILILVILVLTGIINNIKGI